MKKYILYSLSLLLAISFSLTSCGSFLDENPKDQITEEDAYKNPTLVYLNTVASLYTHIGKTDQSAGLQGGDRGIYDLNTFCTDEAMLPTRAGDWYDGGLWQQLYTHDWGTKYDLVKGAWDYIYKVIAESNKSLDKLNEILKNDPENKAVQEYIAEVRSFRALYYYHLVDLFGRVPIVTSSKTAMGDVKQSDRSEVFEFAWNELLESVDLLHEGRSNFPGEYYGRITKPVAYFILARLALNSEVYTHDNWTDGNRPDGKTIKLNVGEKELNAWDAVVYFCDKISELGYYDLDNEFASNFSIQNEKSIENIFTIPMDASLYKNEFYYLIRSRHYAHAAVYGQGGWNGSCATIDAIEAFNYGKENQDPRFDITYYHGSVFDPTGAPIKDEGEELVYYPSEVKLDLTGSPFVKTAGARMKKYELDAAATNDGASQGNDIVLYRYADVLLMKAEAKIRKGESGDAEVNQVRKRAGASIVKDVDLKMLLSERLREFAWEGHRRQDMVRFGTFTQKYTDRNPLPGESTGFTTVYPIHEDVLLLNTNLTQNPGYKTGE